MTRPSLKIGFVGAGGVNFGSPEGPWDHASRIEKLDFVTVVGIADPDTNRAEYILKERKNGKNPSIWQNTKLFSDWRDLLKEEGLDAVIIGLPPHVHGYSTGPFNIEVVCVEQGINIFVEKPLSAAPPEEVELTAEKIRSAQKKNNVVVSVGYMFRYNKAVEKIKEIIKEEALIRRTKLGSNESETNNHVSVITVRFNCAYSEISKSAFWGVDSSGGPIVEQCTHLVDIARFIAESEAISSTVVAQSISPGDTNLGVLADLPIVYGSQTETVESKIPLEKRLPRATTGQWRFESGALCSLSHGLQLHGSNIEADIQVWCDGTRLILEDLYRNCRLSIRRRTLPEEVFEYPPQGSLENDPYFQEITAFLEAVRLRKEGLPLKPSLIRSSFDDALKTYSLTWKVRRAAENSN